MITEEQIYKLLAKMEAETFDDRFTEDQADYWQYLNSEGFKGLSDAENQLSFFINSVIYHTVQNSGEEYEDFDIDFFQEIEETNWDEREKHKTWAAAKDAFFDGFDEEDLLAFVEDMLEDEEAVISDLAKEIIFITAMSYVEFLLIYEQD